MDKHIENQYKPDYAVSPGEVLSGELDALGMTQQELATRTGLTPKHIVAIVKAKSAITPETAIKFERALGLPAEFWLNLEGHYQEALARITDEKRLQRDLPWLDHFPKSELSRLGWIKTHEEPAAQLIELLRFFGIASIVQWEDMWIHLKESKPSHHQHVFSPYVISAWLRRGEIEASGMDCKTFNRAEFRKSISSIRATSASKPDIFLTKMQEISASSGVAVVFLPELKKAKIRGSAHWLAPNKALICLSYQNKTDDKIWFAFLRGAAHILLHGKKTIFLNHDLEKPEDPRVAAAEKFVEEKAIPKKDFATYVSNGVFTKKTICIFSKKFSIAPGIIVSQLQKHGLIGKEEFNDLKQAILWNTHLGKNNFAAPD